MKSEYVIAVDLGTTSTKALVVEPNHGEVKGAYSVEYPLHTPTPYRAEQDPDEIFEAALKAIARVQEEAGIAPEEVLCVSFSSAMHSIIAVDHQGKPLTPCITWADNRSAKYAGVLNADETGNRIYRATGTPIHPISPLLKIMWMRDHDSETYRNTYKFIGIKEYLFAKLFNQYVVDYSIASATGLFNLKQLNWDEFALQTAGITKERLSEPKSPAHSLHGMDSKYAEQMNLPMNTPFVLGASDGTLANLGIGALEPGVYAVTIGTSGAVRGVLREPITDPEGRLFCYALHEDYWVVGGGINNGGIMLRWVRDQLATKEAEEAIRRGQDPYDYLSEIAAQVNPGSDGLLFLPFLTGERAPYWNSNARGTYFGLSIYHEKKQMIRAVFEGVMYRIHSVLTALEELAGPTKEIRASGGFARSQFWTQLLADVAGAHVTVPQSIESSGIGAAKMGLLAMGKIKKLEDLNHWVQIGRSHTSSAEEHEIYEELTSIYMNVYHKLKDEFDAIADFQEKHVGSE